MPNMNTQSLTVRKSWPMFKSRSNPDSKWKLGQHWVLSCNFRWANVGFAMQNHPHFAHPKMLAQHVVQTLAQHVVQTLAQHVVNVGPTCWANVGSLLASGSC